MSESGVILHSFMSTRIRHAMILRTLPALFGAALVTVAGCSKGDASPPSVEATKESAPTSAGAASPKVETETYVVEMKATGPYKVGAEGSIELTLLPKGDYHINKEYPYKFKLDAAPEGITYPKPVLARADGEFEEKKGTFKVPFVATKAGSFKVRGTFSMSVCSAANCLIDKQTMEREVDVR